MMLYDDAEFRNMEPVEPEEEMPDQNGAPDLEEGYDQVCMRVNPIRIESCESFTRAKAFMSECVAITNDSSGSRIIKCE